MYSINLDEDNIEMYMDYMTSDIGENIGRTFYKGIIIAEDDDPLAGMVWENRNMMLGADNESHIIWFRADNEEAADLLFQEYKESVVEDEIKKTSFALPAVASSNEKEILKKNGFTVKFMEGDLIKARLSEIAELPYIRKIKLSENIHALKTMTQRGFNTAIRQFMVRGKYGLCQDLAYLPRSYFENDISCYYENDGLVQGIFLFHKKPSGGLLVVVMAALGNDYGKILMHMIKFSVSTALENYSQEDEVHIDRHNYAALALSEKLLPREFGTPVYIGERQEEE